MSTIAKTILLAVFIASYSCLSLPRVIGVEASETTSVEATNWLDAQHTIYHAYVNGAHDAIHVSPDPDPVHLTFSRLETNQEARTAIFNFTNALPERVLIVDVWLQLRHPSDGSATPLWGTISSDYPNASSPDVKSGGSCELRVTPPGGKGPWRIAVIYATEIISPETNSSHREFKTKYKAISNEVTAR